MNYNFRLQNEFALSMILFINNID